jgi:hypothetical protein
MEKSKNGFRDLRLEIVMWLFRILGVKRSLSAWSTVLYSTYTL